MRFRFLQNGVAPGLVADKRRITPHRQDDTLGSKPMSNTHLFRTLATSPPSRPLPYQPNPRIQPDEKLLSYLPHSGFHDQRIALENALVLARCSTGRCSYLPFALATGRFHTATLLFSGAPWMQTTRRICAESRKTQQIKVTWQWRKGLC